MTRSQDPAHDQGLTPDLGHLVQDTFIYMFTLRSKRFRGSEEFLAC